MGLYVKRIAGRLLRSAIFIAVAVYVGFSALVYFFQERMIFRPTTLPATHQFGLADVQEVRIPVDGAELSALHFRQPEAKGVVFFLHGNAGDLSTWLTSTEFYRRTKFDLFMIDYRGFGKSSGRIENEAQMHADVRRAFDLVAPQYAGKKIVLYGRSLGTGLASKLSTEVNADLTVLVSPYSSILDLGKQFYPWLPGFVSRYPMRSDLWLPQAKSPVFILHGDRDSLIPISHAQRLKALHTAAELLVIEDAEHNDIHKFPKYLDALANRLKAI
jgi:pimeloyl-ACP methyl ester carboxylesterase